MISAPNPATATPAELFDFARAANDFPYYASGLLKIRTKDRQFRLFNQWWPSQHRMWLSIKESMAQGKPVRKIVLKARQMGASTFTEALLFWQVHTRPNTHALVLSQDKDSASTIFEMSRNFYENLPPEYRPLKRYSSKKELCFENPDEKTRLVQPGLRSRIEVQTAGKFVPPRGASFHLVHFSEVAFWPIGKAEEIIPAIMPMVPTLPGSLVIYESTANGYDNFFAEEWEAAIEGDSAFEPLFIPWTVLPEYSIAFDDDSARKKFQKTLDDDEKDLRRRHNVTLEQLHWRRWKISELKGDTDKFRQEYPATEREAFIFSGYPIFNRKILQKLIPSDPIWVGDLDLHSEGLHPDSEGLLKIWEYPNGDTEYVIGVDPSSGTGDDYSCMCVLKRTFPHGLAAQVAEWHGKVDPVALGQLCVVLAKYYNNAMLSIEINNHGLTTQAEAQRNYWHFYRWQYFDRLSGRGYSQKIGWETNISTKPILVDRAVASLRDNLVGITSAGLLDEMWKFVKIPGTMSFEAESGHDDRVMAFMIALCTLYIEDPDAHFAAGSEAHVIAPYLEEKAPALGANVIIPRPMIDNTDPRGTYRSREVDWSNL